MRKRNVLLIGALTGAFVAACSTSPVPIEVSLQASEFAFEPATIQVQAGQQVTVMMQNMGTLEHDFVIQEIPVELMTTEPEAEGGGHEMEGMDMGMEPAVHTGAMAGMTSRVTFVPTQTGTYEFFCAVEGHKEAGMIGTLVVRER